MVYSMSVWLRWGLYYQDLNNESGTSDLMSLLL